MLAWGAKGNQPTETRPGYINVVRGIAVDPDDDTTSKVIKFDLDGHLLYSWGSLGDFPGGLFNMQGAGVDQQGNLYIAGVANGRTQKFRPRAGANPDFLVGKPVYAAWK